MDVITSLSKNHSTKLANTNHHLISSVLAEKRSNRFPFLPLTVCPHRLLFFFQQVNIKTSCKKTAVGTAWAPFLFHTAVRYAVSTLGMAQSVLRPSSTAAKRWKASELRGRRTASNWLAVSEQVWGWREEVDFYLRSLSPNDKGF